MPKKQNKPYSQQQHSARFVFNPALNLGFISRCYWDICKKNLPVCNCV